MVLVTLELFGVEKIDTWAMFDKLTYYVINFYGLNIYLLNLFDNSKSDNV